MPKHSAPVPSLSRLGRVGDVLVNVTAFLGAICLLATAAAFFFGVHIALFKTGSMAPSIPAGSAALSVEMDAAEAQPGDIVTVSRGEGRLPVTHRVVDAQPLADGSAALILKGDANEGNDPFPYEVRSVNRVIWSVPGLGYQVARLQQAPMMGAITVFATLLITWAFWPRKGDDDAPSNSRAATSDRSEPLHVQQHTDQSFAAATAGDSAERLSS